MQRALILVISLALLSSGCLSVTVRPEGGDKVKTKASWQQRQNFYLFGLVGESHIDAQRVCRGRDIAQMQTQQSFVDGLLGLLTIGIYAPHTAKVWCE